MSTPKTPWDGGYHTLFEHHAVIHDLLDLVPTALQAAVDRGWSEPYKTDSYDGPAFKKRDNDVILKLHLRQPAQEPPKEALLWLMLEFQLTPQWAMSLRALTYACGLQEHLLARLQEDARRAHRGDPAAQREAVERQRLPPLFVVVFYHGESPWPWPTDLRGIIDLPTGSPLLEWQPQLRFLLIREQEPRPGELEDDNNLASLIMRLNQCRDLDLLRRVLVRLGQRLQGPLHQKLREDLIAWVLHVLARKHNINVTRDDLAPLKQEEPMGLEQYAEQIADQIYNEGMEKGIEKGKAEGKAEGEAEGIKKGKAEGALLARVEALEELLTERFGGDERWAALWEGADLERLRALFKAALAAPDKDAFLATARQ